ncbi:BA75_01253T0 [Komagataella pastoris]|uniref:BA75_01253T0 n=1 Tax=Komagataella pastoris TaxID=4922 RepID=A0A1B2J8W5_PICPA|nr:BA75_01253T0 [Komagataella pastoris]
MFYPRNLRLVEKTAISGRNSPNSKVEKKFSFMGGKDEPKIRFGLEIVTLNDTNEYLVLLIVTLVVVAYLIPQKAISRLQECLEIAFLLVIGWSVYQTIRWQWDVYLEMRGNEGVSKLKSARQRKSRAMFLGWGIIATGLALLCFLLVKRYFMESRPLPDLLYNSEQFILTTFSIRQWGKEIHKNVQDYISQICAEPSQPSEPVKSEPPSYRSFKEMPFFITDVYKKLESLEKKTDKNESESLHELTERLSQLEQAMKLIAYQEPSLSTGTRCSKSVPEQQIAQPSSFSLWSIPKIPIHIFSWCWSFPKRLLMISLTLTIKVLQKVW